MRARRAATAAVLVALAAVLSACGDLSCWVDLPPNGDMRPTVTVGVGAATSTSGAVTTLPATAPPVSYTAPSTAAVTTTTAPPTALDIYKTEMRAWKNEYAADMQLNYNVLSEMGNPLDPTAEQVRAARTLADLMDGLVADLKMIKAPPELAAAHSAYATSLEDMHDGVDRLAEGLEDGGFMGSIDIARAFSAIYSADKDGKQPRTTLEGALGFSLTSAD